MRSTPAKLHPVLNYLLTALLWLAGLVLGLYAIYNLLEIVISIYVLLGGENQYVAGVLRYVTTFFGAIAWLFAVIYSGEYSLKHIGERGTWVRFGWILGIEIALVLIGTLFRST